MPSPCKEAGTNKGVLIMIEAKALGQTIQHEGKVVLVVSGDLPPDCIVIFVDKEVWKEIKDEVNITRKC